MNEFILSLMASSAFQKYQQRRRQDLSFADACGFWDITENDRGSALDARLEYVTATLRSVEDAIGEGCIESSGGQNGKNVPAEDIAQCIEAHEYLLERFSRHLDLLRSRCGPAKHPPEEISRDLALKHWLGLWDYLDGNFWGFWQWANAELTQEQVCWQPCPAVASIGWNLRHLAEMLDYYLTHVFGQGASVFYKELATIRSGHQDDGRFRDLQAIADYHRQVRPAYRTFLAGLNASKLERVIERQGKRAFTYAWAVGHIAEHESYHLGKCTQLRSLLANRFRAD